MKTVKSFFGTLALAAVVALSGFSFQANANVNSDDLMLAPSQTVVEAKQAIQSKAAGWIKLKEIEVVKTEASL